jgi:hypothetical protein
VTDLAEPPLQAEIIISSSMTESLILHAISDWRVPQFAGAQRTSRFRSGE